MTIGRNGAQGSGNLSTSSHEHILQKLNDHGVSLHLSLKAYGSLKDYLTGNGRVGFQGASSLHEARIDGTNPNGLKWASGSLTFRSTPQAVEDLGSRACMEALERVIAKNVKAGTPVPHTCGFAAGSDVSGTGNRALLEVIERDTLILTDLLELPAERSLVDDGLLDMLSLTPGLKDEFLENFDFLLGCQLPSVHPDALVTWVILGRGDRFTCGFGAAWKSSPESLVAALRHALEEALPGQKFFYTAKIDSLRNVIKNRNNKSGSDIYHQLSEFSVVSAAQAQLIMVSDWLPLPERVRHLQTKVDRLNKHDGNWAGIDWAKASLVQHRMPGGLEHLQVIECKVKNIMSPKWPVLDPVYVNSAFRERRLPQPNHARLHLPCIVY